MTRGNGIHAHEGLELRIEQGPLDDLPPDGIWTVEDDERNFLSGRGLHRERHRGNVRPGPASDLLEVVDQDVDVLQHLGRGTAIFRHVEGEDRNARLPIGLVRNLLALGGVATDAVFRRQQRHESQLSVLRNKVDVRRPGAVNAALVGDEANALAAHPGRNVGKEHFDSGSHGSAVTGGRAGCLNRRTR